MEKLVGKLLDHKWLVLVLFIIATAISFILWLTVDVNHDMYKYLPSDAPSTVSVEKLNEEFDESVSNTRVLIEGLEINEALQKKKEFAEIDGVVNVMWLDDVIDLKRPIETYKKSELESFYKDGYALFLLTLSSDDMIHSVDEIERVAGDGANIEGSTIEVANSMKNTNTEVSRIMMFVIPLIFVILIITTSSWVEPVILLVTIVIAIILNNGTNAFKGEISFVTQSAASLLQLAVSLDYTIFLFHRFAEQRELGLSARDSIIKATHLSFNSIMSSGLTTSIGFAALMLMRFKVGPDMGFVMTKAIFFSLISVFLLLPVLLLFSYRLIEKTHHKILMPRLTILNKTVGRLGKVGLVIMVIFFLSVSVTAFLSQSYNNFIYGSSKMIAEGSDIAVSKAKIEKVFGKDNQMLIMVPKGDVTKEYQLLNALKSIPEYSYSFAYSEQIGHQVPPQVLTKEQQSVFYSDNYSRIVVSFDVEKEGEDVYKVIDTIRSESEKIYDDQYYLVGESVTTYDMKIITGNDSSVVNIIAIIAVGIVILIAFKSITIPIILLLVIETSIWLNMSVPYYSSESIFFMTFLIVSSIQLGATVDYAILFSNRYIENRATLHKREAVNKTISDTSISILTSGIILTLAGLMLGTMSSNMFISQHGQLIGRGAFFSLLSVLIFLPVFMLLFDSLIEKTTLGVTFKGKGEE